MYPERKTDYTGTVWPERIVTRLCMLASRRKYISLIAAQSARGTKKTDSLQRLCNGALGYSITRWVSGVSWEVWETHSFIRWVTRCVELSSVYGALMMHNSLCCLNYDVSNRPSYENCTACLAVWSGLAPAAQKCASAFAGTATLPMIQAKLRFYCFYFPVFTLTYAISAAFWVLILSAHFECGILSAAAVEPVLVI